MGMAPRLHDEAEDMRFLMDTCKREEAGQQLSSVGAGTVHLRLQLLFRVRCVFVYVSVAFVGTSCLSHNFLWSNRAREWQ
jgi:hypothetical protein